MGKFGLKSELYNTCTTEQLFAQSCSKITDEQKGDITTWH